MTKKLKPIVEAEFTEVPKEVPQENEQVLNLDQVDFMITIGRYKNGEPFFIPVNVTDLFTIDGMIDYGKQKIANTYREHFDKVKVEKGE